MKCRTIFLGTDGRHATLARDAKIDLSDTQKESLNQQGQAGWVVWVEGSMHDKIAPTMQCLSTIGDVADDAWPKGLELFEAMRR